MKKKTLKPEIWINKKPFGMTELCWVDYESARMMTPGKVEIPRSVGDLIIAKFHPKRRRSKGKK